ncbi:hypothetical protein T08_9445 [Trichinella sp. T8]|nr:hypothetical protein T08_9445 [Trichinella sp. T8]
MTAIKVATVVDPVGIRAINEVAFFGNYALLNIQLLLFNSYPPGFPPRLCPRANKNLHMPSSYAQGILLHNICPQGTPGFPPRLCPRANKNLHMPSSYAQGILLHNICPQGTPGFPPRLCPRANKNLHIPSSYAQGTLLHNFCPEGSFMQILGATPQAKFWKFEFTLLPWENIPVLLTSSA